MNDFLFEIATEELPAGYISPASDFMASWLEKKFQEKRIDFGKIEKYSTPKRLALIVRELSEKQKETSTKVMGPPEKVGFKDGKACVPAEKFAEKIGISVDEIKIEETEKGRYLYGIKVEETLFTKDILKNILPELVKKIPFPKSMRWADHDISFARPVTGFTALFGNDLIEFDLEGIKSSKETNGHRFLFNEKIEIDNPSEYIEKLEKAYVLCDREKRKSFIEKEVEKAAAKADGFAYKDEALLDEVTGLVEYPVIHTGKFDDKFLNLPDEVLYTAMKKHQKYFAVLNDKKEMLPYFITVSNIIPKDENIVISGNERVLRARLSDADFFFETDLKSDFESWNKELDNVMFQAKLGSTGEKVKRIEKNAAFISNKFGFSKELENEILRTARLCKADLVSFMVDEFANLQGIMGRIYSKVKGESDNVAFGIEEHYKPVSAGASLPETWTGIVVSIADKMDSICGCFSIGFLPTGASDPYALRRQCIGIIQIMKEKKVLVSLDEIIKFSLSHFRSYMTEDESFIFDEIKKFFEVRLEQILVDEGFSRDLVSSVISADSDIIPYVCERVEAITELKNKNIEEFESLVRGFKRAGNILKKSEILNVEINPALFENDYEKTLYKKLQLIKEEVLQYVGSGKTKEALFELAGIRSEIDGFFDNVMVLVEDEKIRNNRTALLHEISMLFDKFADFSGISD
ncbi:MAG: glycine--tRNA ligase subunit beta [Deltaproteobacteria bacterium]|nr:MAG: glycine--tRNA ligase subunit beta [Deltaproteobacteria bacterium]